MPTWRERLKAHGEVPRGALDAYKVAGRSVYQYVLDLDSLRAEGDSLPAVQAALLAGWVAFSLQVLGDEMLDADAALDPATANYVPPATAQQVTEFYEPVRAWIGRAQAAKANPSYQLDVALPEVLPPWVEVEPCPPAHVFALRQAVTRLRQYTEGLVPGFDSQQGHAGDLVAQGLAEAGSAADYATGMWGDSTSEPLPQAHAVIESSLKTAAETYFYLGQVIAMPSLADAPRRVRDEGAADQTKEKPQSFLESMTRAYPQVGQPRQGGALASAAGGFLGGLVGGAIIQEILGGSGFGGDGGDFGVFGGGDFGGDGGDFGDWS